MTGPDSLAALLQGLAADRARPALSCLGRATRAGDFARDATRAAAGLATLSIGPGESLALCLPDTTLTLQAACAALIRGATLLPLDPEGETVALSARLAATRPKAIVTLDIGVLFDRVLRLHAAAPAATVLVGRYAELLPFPRNWLLPLMRSGGLANLPPDPRYRRWSDLREAPPDAAPAPAGVGHLRCMDGTIDEPTLLAAARGAAPTLEPHRKLLLAAPFTEPAAFALALASLAGGVELILSPRRDDPTLLRQAKRQGASLLAADRGTFEKLSDESRAEFAAAGCQVAAVEDLIGNWTR